MTKIRNFSIIAHIDHGKSTLAQRIIEYCYNVKNLNNDNLLMDSLNVEKKHGITVKLNFIQLKYKALDNNTYTLNLIDTPGHIDFAYEVSRSLSACEGSILLVDATQGVQAQTLSTVDLALENNLEIVPVINKIDMNNADIPQTIEEIEKSIGLNCTNISKISAKKNINIINVLENIVNIIPPPKVNLDLEFKGLVFDCHYDQYMGAMIYIKVVSGVLNCDDNIFFINKNFSSIVKKIYIKKLKMESVKYLQSGNIGIIFCNMKDLKKVKIGDTIIKSNNIDKSPLPGYEPPKPVVFASFFPINSADINKLYDALCKIQINDSSIIFKQESSPELGLGFRCGFLGTLHMEITKERIENEYNLFIISAIPTITYLISKTNGEMEYITNPNSIPDPSKINYIKEQIAYVTLITKAEYYGKIINYTITEKRGSLIKKMYLNVNTLLINIKMPFSELIIEYFNMIKSLSKGYCSISYKLGDFELTNVVKIRILLNNVEIPPLSFIIAKQFAYKWASKMCKILKNVISKHSFAIPIQAAINNKVIARETIKGTRKDVIAGLYGGDITRKRKLLEKQKKGKKKMKAFGKVMLTQQNFFDITKKLT